MHACASKPTQHLHVTPKPCNSLCATPRWVGWSVHYPVCQQQAHHTSAPSAYRQTHTRPMVWACRAADHHHTPPPTCVRAHAPMTQLCCSCYGIWRHKQLLATQTGPGHTPGNRGQSKTWQQSPSHTKPPPTGIHKAQAGASRASRHTASSGCYRTWNTNTKTQTHAHISCSSTNASAAQC